MDKENKLQLTKRAEKFKITIPDSVEKIIRFLCSKVWNTEWSGVLFYRAKGSFETDNLEIICEDILPMDIGSATYTEFDQSPEVISYMAEHPDLLNCFTGLIHSHNNMSTFFSGTDTDTLLSQGSTMPHFVSLIVNNAGTYTAAITRKITYTEIRDISYQTFGGLTVTSKEEFEEDKEVEYFMLDVTVEGAKISFPELAERLEAIKKEKEAKQAKRPVITTPTNPTNHTYQMNLYDAKANAAPNTGYPYYPSYGSPAYTQFKYSDKLDKDLEDTFPFGDEGNIDDIAEDYAATLDSVAKAIVFGNTLMPENFDINKWKFQMVASLKRRFKTMEAYENWITDLMDELLVTKFDANQVWSIADFAEDVKTTIKEYEISNEYIDTILSYLNTFTVY